MGGSESTNKTIQKLQQQQQNSLMAQERERAMQQMYTNQALTSGVRVTEQARHNPWQARVEATAPLKEAKHISAVKIEAFI